MAAFLRKTFHCKYLCANLTPEECKVRQKRKIEETRFGRRFILNNDPQARYCRSGECKQGKEQIVKLRVRRKRLREKKQSHAAVR